MRNGRKLSKKLRRRERRSQTGRVVALVTTLYEAKQCNISVT